jgi:DNA-binding CsgD family transcriptional regulator
MSDGVDRLDGTGKRWMIRMARTREWRNEVQRQMDMYGFTLAEQRVAWTLFDFQTSRDIGEAIGASPQTIKNHLTQMLRKTKTQNRLELVLVLLHLEDDESREPGLQVSPSGSQRRSVP